MNNATITRLMAEGNFREAALVVDAALARDMNNVTARCARARIDDPVDRVPLEKLAAAFPDSPEPLIAMAAMTLQDDTAAAGDLIMQAVRHGGRGPELEFLLGKIAEDEGDDAGALEAFEAALSMAPKFFGALLGRATACQALGRLAESEGAFIEAVTQKPDATETWVALIRLEHGAGATAAARMNLAKARVSCATSSTLEALAAELELSPQDRAQSDAEALEGVDVIEQHLRDDEPTKAMEKTHRLVTAAPDSAAAVVARGLLASAGLVSKDDLPVVIHGLTRRSREVPCTTTWRTLADLHLRNSPLFNAQRAIEFAQAAFEVDASPGTAALLVRALLGAHRRSFAQAFVRRLESTDHVAIDSARAALIL